MPLYKLPKQEIIYKENKRWYTRKIFTYRGSYTHITDIITESVYKGGQNTSMLSPGIEHMANT